MASLKQKSTGGGRKRKRRSSPRAPSRLSFRPNGACEIQSRSWFADLTFPLRAAARRFASEKGIVAIGLLKSRKGREEGRADGGSPKTSR